MVELELWQAEWCPDSYIVRQRLTELNVDFVAHQVPVQREARTALLAATGQAGIPAIVFTDRTVTTGDPGALVAELDRRFRDPADTAEREQAAVDHERPPIGRAMHLLATKTN